jgi:uncharacterized membrane protein
VRSDFCVTFLPSGGLKVITGGGDLSEGRGPIRHWRHAWRVAGLTAPLHPILVHFTIAFFVGSVACDAVGYMLGSRSLLEGAWWMMAGSLLATPPTVLTGALSRRRLPMEESEARSFLRGHMAVGFIIFGLLTILTLWRARIWEAGDPVTLAYLGLAGASVVIMTLQGYLGGELVYRYGTEVANVYRQLPDHESGSRPPALFPSESVRNAKMSTPSP